MVGEVEEEMKRGMIKEGEERERGGGGEEEEREG